MAKTADVREEPKVKKSLLDSAEKHARMILLNQLAPAYLFHNLEHTTEVVKICQELAAGEGIEGEDLENLLIAAWFHDTGMTGGHDGHEDRSAKIAGDFLESEAVPTERVKKIKDLILSTGPDREETTLSEKILHDADWAFLGRKRFFRRGKLLRLEYEHTQGKEFTLFNWNKKLLNLQLEHTFYTISARNNYLNRKHKNIAEQRQNMVRAKKTTVRQRTGKDFGRGIDTVYRTTLRNHINLSTIADGKANMIISINTLVLSILITAATAGASIGAMNIESNLQVIAPVLVLMVTSLIAIIFAVLSAIPKVGGQDFTEEDIEARNVSLLFFGNFLKIPKEKFVSYLRNLKKDQAVLYDDLSRDLYNLGGVLKKKYRLLTIAYRVFIAGLIISVLVFLAISLI